MNARLAIPAHLRPTCRKCTKEQGFAGTREEAQVLAGRAGWLIEQVAIDRQTAVCSKCPGIRRAFDARCSLPARLPALSREQRAEIGAEAIATGNAVPGDVLTLPQFPDEPPIVAEPVTFAAIGSPMSDRLIKGQRFEIDLGAEGLR